MTTRSVRTIVISNPSTRNALDDQTRRRLLGDLTDCMSDSGCGAVVVTGGGSTFCSGGDVPSMPSQPKLIRARLGEMHEIVRHLAGGPKAVVAAVEGSAIGSGLAIASACDVVVAAEDARFGCTFGTLALIPDTGLLWTLSGRVGRVTARRLALSNATLETPEGFRLGLVDHQTEPGGALAAAHIIASRLAQQYSPAVHAVKAILNSGGDFDAVLKLEMEAQIGLLGSPAFHSRRAELFGSPQIFQQSGSGSE
jgi:2-(1,2-epoxy-1,2-dihydrophenyl)acetyl-CoA isomerase